MQSLRNPASTEGWSVQIYGGNRRLLLSLDASHAWLFGAGIVVGFVVAVIGLSHERLASAPLIEVSPQVAPLQLD